MMGYNVLPWRVRDHRRGLRQLWQGALIAGLLALMVSVVPYHRAAHALDEQGMVSQALVQEVQKQQQTVITLRHQEKKYEAINNRIHWIEQIEQQRNTDITLLNVLPSLVPEGLYLSELKRDRDRLHFSGNTVSNDQVSEMMRRMGSFPLLQGPVLEQIEANLTHANDSHFTLQANLMEP
jgi:type IV pilus assembly protein PilN